MGLFHNILVYMEDLHLVIPSLNLCILDAGILKMVQQVSLKMCSLSMVDYPMSFLSLSTWNVFGWTSRGDHSKMFLLCEFCCGTPPSCLKVISWVAYRILVSSPFGLWAWELVGIGPRGTKGLGPGLDNSSPTGHSVIQYSFWGVKCSICNEQNPFSFFLSRIRL